MPDKKIVRHKRIPKGIKNNLIELKITHILPKYEKTKSEDLEIYDGKHLTVWQNEDDINFWIGRTITILPADKWDEIKRELREMLFKDVKIKDYDGDDED